MFNYKEMYLNLKEEVDETLKPKLQSLQKNINDKTLAMRNFEQEVENLEKLKEKEIFNIEQNHALIINEKNKLIESLMGEAGNL